MSPSLILLSTLYLASSLFLIEAASIPRRANPQCATSAILLPELKGIEILSITANEVHHWDDPGNQYSWLPLLPDLSFCNVTIAYMHQGWNDRILIYTWLPLESEWNGRFMSTGGGGFATGSMVFGETWMPTILSYGFVTSTINTGHDTSADGTGSLTSNWAINSAGNLNWANIMDFSSVALHDEAVIEKVLVEAYYGTPARYAYFFGSSTGGRQAHMLAQRYPTDYNGIIGMKGAINWVQFLFADIYPIFLMDSLNFYPRPCEVQAFTAAALAACDEIDGIKDGIISQPGLCDFDPYSLVGKSFDCGGVQATFASETAQIVEGAWDGPRSADGKWQWYGFSHDTDISVSIAGTQCFDNGTCIASPFAMTYEFLSKWVLKDPLADLRNLTHEEWDRLFHDSSNEFESIIGTRDPDLSQFRKAGGKFLNLHGTVDNAISFNGSIDYFNRVQALDPEVHDYYRLFLAPGVDHRIQTSISPLFESYFSAIVDWVENGAAPETMLASGNTTTGVFMERPLCSFPKTQVYVSGDETKLESFACV